MKRFIKFIRDVWYDVKELQETLDRINTTQAYSIPDEYYWIENDDGTLTINPRWSLREEVLK